MPFGNVAAERAAIEATYDGLCTVTEIRTVKDPETNISKQKPVNVLENQPCALSQTSLPAADQTDTAANIDYDAKLFVAPEIDVKPGSLVTVVQDGMTFHGEQAGRAFRYPTHQEIKLKDVDRA